MEDIDSRMLILSDWLAVVACSTAILGLIQSSARHRHWIWYSFTGEVLLAIFWLYYMLRDGNGSGIRPGSARSNPIGSDLDFIIFGSVGSGSDSDLNTFIRIWIWILPLRPKSDPKIHLYFPEVLFFN